MRIKRVTGVALAACGLFGGISPASAAVLGERLCQPGKAGPAGEQFPTDAALSQAAALAQQHIRQIQFSDAGEESVAEQAARAALDVETTATTAPGPAAIAQYCYASGELVRVSAVGGQYQAQLYLLAALHQAQAAASDDLTAQIAYKLGLIETSGTTARGVRGGGFVRRNGRAIAQRIRAAQSLDANAPSCRGVAPAQADGGAAGSLAMLGLDCAARVATDAGNPVISALASLRFARNATELARSSETPGDLPGLALDRALTGLANAAAIAEPELRAELLGRLSLTALELGADGDARLPAAIAQIRGVSNGRPAAAATAFELEARLALKRGDKARARALIEQAILEESRRALPLRVPAYFLLLAEAEPEQRARHVSAAYAALENIRPRLPRFDPLTEESMFVLHMRQVFESAADVQLAATGIDGDQIRKAQEIVETYRQAELQSAVGSECLPQRVQVRPEDFAAGETLLYPLVFDDRVELIVVSGDETGSDRRFRRLPPNRTANRREISRLADRLTIELNAGGDGWREPARRLYDVLIKPIEHHLAPGSSLAIVPDRALRGVPFAALLGADGQYLVQRTALSVAPALAYSQPGASLADGRVSIVAASLQREVFLAAGIFPALAGTASEAKIAALNGSPGKFVEDFTRAQLATALGAGRVDVLHLATHASFNGRSDRAYIVASDGVIRLAELRNMITQNRVRDDALDLLVLSACETAVGDDESNMGLAGAAVQAGALSAIASLWPVDDVGATELMRLFYQSYRSGRPRAQALRDAQVALLKAGGDNADPFVWAAFTLVGAWR